MKPGMVGHVALEGLVQGQCNDGVMFFPALTIAVQFLTMAVGGMRSDDGEFSTSNRQ
jgi:hypothetical protein